MGRKFNQNIHSTKPGRFF